MGVFSGCDWWVYSVGVVGGCIQCVWLVRVFSECGWWVCSVGVVGVCSVGVVGVCSVGVVVPLVLWVWLGVHP